MRVGLLGPVGTRDLADLLGTDPERLPYGEPGSPLTLLARGLVQAGHAVRLWTLDWDVTAPARASGDGLEVVILPKRRRGRGRDGYAEEVRWLRAALAHGPDVDVLNPHWSYEFALACVRRPEPVVVTVRDWAPTILRYTPDPYRVARLGMFLRTHLRRPALTTPSPYLADVLRRAGLGRARVIPNGLPPEQIVASPRRRGGGMHLVGIARGFDRRKNTRALLLAHAELRRRGLPATLALYGAAHEPGGPAAAWAASAGVGAAVDFRGDVPYGEVLQALRAADLLVHTAREESFGKVLIEAMAQGTPVVGGRRSGAVPWVLDGGRAGALVDVEDPSAVADGAQAVLGNAAVWERFSRDGLAQVRQRFAMAVVVDGYVSAYQEAIGAR